MTETKTTGRRKDPTTAVLAEVKAERKLLDEDKPLGGGLRPERARLYYRREADRWADIATARALAGRGGWDGELLAATFAALAEPDAAAAKRGLVQAAALAVAAAQGAE
ncbi:hypothetical protein Q3V23_23130 [Streptomyces sp. VNUA116]|uniref:hypothetical protein n=1 Tax=Streptomyces sp. VNUA116 TaxID=3062449 RepID=UPI00267475AE|nr:hypothetical protein [Streptomyces sp. VNUA116]WKU46720.1 hypothetical protein Q3V23_23130 [Streptomyces sp. VNUA116]